jgi:hypothetical protein
MLDLLTLDRLPLIPLLALPLALLLEILPLLVSTHATQFLIPRLAFRLVTLELALFGFLVVVEFADLGDLLFARLLDAAHGFGTEVRCLHQVIGELEEVLKDGEGRVVGAEFDGKVDALAGSGLIESNNG